MRKNLLKILMLFSLFTLSACTYSTAPSATPDETAASAPPLMEQTAPSRTQEVRTTQESDTQTAVTTEVEVTEESLPEGEPTPTIEDPFASVDPSGQRVFLWYFLPAQGPADLAFNRVVDLFNQNNPDGIFIDAYNQSTPTGILTRTLPVLNTVDVPGLIMTDADLVYQLDDGLLDLNPLLNSPRWGFSPDQQAGFSQPMLTQGQFPTYTEQLLSFPLLRQAHVLYSNTEWITELGFVRSPRTAEELQNLACLASSTAMRRASSDSLIGLQVDPGLASMAALINAFGGEIGGPDSSFYEVNTPAAIEAMQYLQSLTAADCAGLGPVNQEAITDFGAAREALLLASITHMTELESAVEAGRAFAWNASGFPAPEESQAPVIIPGLNFSIPRSSPEQMLAAWLFVRYFHSPEAQAVWIPVTGSIPISVQLAEEAGMPAAYTNVLRQVDQSLFVAALPQYAAVDQLAAQAMQEIAAGASVERRLAQLQAEIDERTAGFFNQP